MQLSRPWTAERRTRARAPLRELAAACPQEPRSRAIAIAGRSATRVVSARTYIAVPMADANAADWEKEPESRALLAHHEFVATYSGILKRACMFMTSLCPDKCDHPNEFGMFQVGHYLAWEKPGEYGDEKAQEYGYIMKQKGEGQAEISAKIRELAEGDKVKIVYDHEYVTKGGSKFPGRPMRTLEKLTEEEFKALCATPAI
eukprot:gene21842-28871_t